MRHDCLAIAYWAIVAFDDSALTPDSFCDRTVKYYLLPDGVCITVYNDQLTKDRCSSEVPRNANLLF